MFIHNWKYQAKGSPHIMAPDYLHQLTRLCTDTNSIRWTDNQCPRMIITNW
ncbi:MAG: hypothetical protein U5L00_17780 [Desulfovermiculus sp.]|nr:hypothetical protein [Desulfovermiculus sp.]